MTVHELVQQAKSHLAQAQELRSRSEGREPTAGEKALIDQHLTEAVRLKDQAVAAKDRQGLLKALDDFGEAIGVDGGSPGDPSWTRQASGLAGEWAAKMLDRFHAKGAPITGTVLVPSPVLDPVRDPERPRFVTDLIPSGRVDGSVAPYWRQTNRDLTPPRSRSSPP
jgi:hypothetical protein